MNVRLLQFLLNLREELIEVVGGVENSSGFGWDRTQSNFSAKIKINDIFSRCLTHSNPFGLFMVTRHALCPNPKHEEYVVANSYGLDIVYNSPDYLWTGDQLYQGKRNCICPCDKDNPSTLHYVIEDIIYAKGSDPLIYEGLYRILNNVHEAKMVASDSRPRAAIRECLLRAILDVNDMLLPVPMKEYVAQLRDKSTQ